MSSIYTGVAGMQSSQQAVDVVANNIANLNTTAYKAERITFQETLLRTLSTGTTDGINPMQVGMGNMVASIDRNMEQGNLKQTGRALDLAISGDAYFIVGDSNGGQHFTRDGDLQLDAQNRLVMASNGLPIVGWPTDPTTGGIITTGAPVTITVPVGSSYAVQTMNCSFGGNLNASAAVDDTANASIVIYDSIGTSHKIDVTYTKTDPGVWTWTATSPDADAGTTVGTGTLTFDSQGMLASSDGTISLTFTSAGGATNPLNATPDFSAITQLDGASTVQPLGQDGLPSGVLQSVSIDQNGIVNGSFSNGATRVFGSLALARFANIPGLLDAGNGLWNASANSGVALIQPVSSSESVIRSGYLEMSNVDLSAEFANLIVYQRGFQANSRSITTSDEMMQDILQMKR